MTPERLPTPDDGPCRACNVGAKACAYGAGFNDIGPCCLTCDHPTWRRVVTDPRLDAVLRLHSRSISTLEAYTDERGEWRAVEPGSAEDVVGAEEICGGCLKAWPCATIRAIREASAK